MNKIKGLERIVQHRDEEILRLKSELRKKEFQYEEMKKRAMLFKQRAVANQTTQMMPTMPFGNMGMQFYNPQSYIPQQLPIIPKSVSNESIPVEHMK